MKVSLESAIATFGAAAKQKLSNPSATGQPEEQLRAPLENLFGDLAELAGIPKKETYRRRGDLTERTFLLGVLRRIAETVAADEGQGAVPGAINAAVGRLIAFEMQLGPFAVAQLRILAEIVELTGAIPKSSARMFVTNTLGNPRG